MADNERDDLGPEPDEWGEFMAEYAFEQPRVAEDYMPTEFDPESFPIPERDPFEHD